MQHSKPIQSSIVHFFAALIILTWSRKSHCQSFYVLNCALYLWMKFWILPLADLCVLPLEIFTKTAHLIVFGDPGSGFKSLKFSQPQTDFECRRRRLTLSPGKDAARPRDTCPQKNKKKEEDMYLWIWSSKRDTELRLSVASAELIRKACSKTSRWNTGGSFASTFARSSSYFSRLTEVGSVLTHPSALSGPSVLIWEGSQMPLVDSSFDGNRADMGENRDLWASRM